MIFASWYHYILKIITRIFNRNTTVFDIGCGQGLILKKLKQKGFKVYGCDIVKPLVDSLTALNYNVFLGSIENYPSNWTAPDVIVLSEVVEHLSNPVEFIRNIIKKFPKTILIISVPHPKRPHLFAGTREYWDYPPNHFTRWTAKSLEIFLKKIGYNKVNIIEYPVYWREALIPVTRKILKLLHSQKEDKLQEDIDKLSNSYMKLLLSPFLYLFGKLLGRYYTAKDLKGQSLIAIAYP